MVPAPSVFRSFVRSFCRSRVLSFFLSVSLPFCLYFGLPPLVLFRHGLAPRPFFFRSRFRSPGRSFDRSLCFCVVLSGRISLVRSFVLAFILSFCRSFVFSVAQFFFCPFFPVPPPPYLSVLRPFALAFFLCFFRAAFRYFFLLVVLSPGRSICPTLSLPFCLACAHPLLSFCLPFSRLSFPLPLFLLSVLSFALPFLSSFFCRSPFFMYACLPFVPSPTRSFCRSSVLASFFLSPFCRSFPRFFSFCRSSCVSVVLSFALPAFFFCFSSCRAVGSAFISVSRSLVLPFACPVFLYSDMSLFCGCPFCRCFFRAFFRSFGLPFCRSLFLHFVFFSRSGFRCSPVLSFCRYFFLSPRPVFRCFLAFLRTPFLSCFCIPLHIFRSFLFCFLVCRTPPVVYTARHSFLLFCIPFFRMAFAPARPYCALLFPCFLVSFLAVHASFLPWFLGVVQFLECCQLLCSAKGFFLQPLCLSIAVLPTLLPSLLPCCLLVVSLSPVFPAVRPFVLSFYFYFFVFLSLLRSFALLCIRSVVLAAPPPRLCLSVARPLPGSACRSLFCFCLAFVRSAVAVRVP